MTTTNNKQTGVHLENQINLLCEKGLTALYERLSQEDRNEGESNSIANQKRILENYCENNGYKAVEHYEDDGYTGTNFNRPGFQRMLADIKAGKIARVIVKDMSRLGRDYLQVGMYTDVVFPEFGVHFIAVNDGVDSRRGDNEFTAIRNVFNEMYARDTSKKIKATFQNKGKSGERLSSTPPYGYLKHPNDKKTWLVDEEAASVVQTVFNLCIEGLGPAQIAKRLRDNQIMSPAAYWVSKDIKTPAKPTSDPCKWATRTIADMLDKLEYLGHTVNFKTQTKSFKDRKTLFNTSDKWAIFKNTHEAIINESVFEIVQNLRKTRKRPTRQGDMGLFSGILFCEDCGAKMYLSRAKNFKPEQEYYICSNYRKNRELCDTTHSIRNVVLKEIVLKNLREAIAYVSMNEKDFLREAADISAQKHDKGLAEDKQALTKAEKRVNELDTIIKKLYEDNVTGKLTDERFMKLSRDYEFEQKGLIPLIETMRHDIKQQQQKRQNTKAFITATKKYTDLKELDGAILREFIDRIEISATEKYKKKQTRKINIVYNFVGAFDFNAASVTAEVVQKEKKTA